MSKAFPPPDPETLAGPNSAHRDESITAAFAVSAAITALAGAAFGLVWGGIGGRIAMRVALLTSSEHVRGLTSDDGFEIGTISAATVFLLIPGLWGASVIVVTERVLHPRHLTGLPVHVHHRYFGAIGWVLITGITMIGARDLVADISTLT